MGLKPDEFWKLTYNEFIEMLIGHRKRERHEINKLLYTAWHMAVFSRQKKIPELKTILIDEEQQERPKEQTPEQMLAIVRIWNAAYGGTVVEN